MPDRDISVSETPSLNPVSRVRVDAKRSGNMGRDGYEVLSQAPQGRDEYGFAQPRARRTLASPVYKGPSYGDDC